MAMTTRNRSILVRGLVWTLLTIGAVPAISQQIGVSQIQERWIIAGIAGSGVAIGVGVTYVVRHDRSLTGCVFSGEKGLLLKSRDDHQTFSLAGEVAGIKPGERVRVSGKKRKKNAALPREFLVEKFHRELSPCNVSTAARRESASGSSKSSALRS